MVINTVIVEDNQIERQMLYSYLASMPGISVIGVFGSGKEVLERIKDQSIDVDVAVLDVELPDIDGLSLAISLREQKPNILLVFITGHTDYAVNAFQIEAVDYLVKPITKETIERMIKKIHRFKKSFQSTHTEPSTIEIKDGHNTIFVKLTDIIFIERVQRKTVFHTNNKVFSTNESLSSIAARLNNNFFRCHQGFIINIDRVERISPIADRIYEISFIDFPLTATTTKRRLDELFTLLRQKG